MLYNIHHILWELVLQKTLTETFERKFLLKCQSRMARMRDRWWSVYLCVGLLLVCLDFNL